jgi:stage V sporulation protein G
MNITDVQIIFPHNTDTNSKLKCFVNIVFDAIFIVRNIRVIEGSKGFFVVMPNFKRKDGSFQDTAHPLNNAFRQQIDDKVLEAYEEALKRRAERVDKTDSP